MAVMTTAASGGVYARAVLIVWLLPAEDGPRRATETGLARRRVVIARYVSSSPVVGPAYPARVASPASRLRMFSSPASSPQVANSSSRDGGAGGFLSLRLATGHLPQRGAQRRERVELPASEQV